jgi:hypothetical protein
MFARIVMILAIALTVTGFNGCAPMEPRTVAEAQRAVHQIKIGYSAAQRAFLKYSKYPPCSTPGVLVPFCTNPEVIAAGKRADALAYATLNAAEAAVHAPEFGESQIGAVIASARAALKIFKEVTDKLPVKPEAKAKPEPSKVSGIALLTA